MRQTPALVRLSEAFQPAIRTSARYTAARSLDAAQRNRGRSLLTGDFAFQPPTRNTLRCFRATTLQARDITTRSLDEAQRNRGCPQRAIAYRNHCPGIRYASSGLLDLTSATLDAWFVIVAISSRAARIFSR